MTDYTLVTHADIGDTRGLHRALADLDALTFSHYDDVVVTSPAFMSWFTARPGMDPHLCQAAFSGDVLVSNVFVTVAPMKIAGETLPCGLIDTVMTHPDHRRRGLARELLRRAIDGMKAAGARISFLNTLLIDPPSGPQQLYQSLGYRPYAPVVRYVKDAPHTASAPPAVQVPPNETARNAFAERLSERTGWIDLDEDLWRWRRVDRPAEYPVTIGRTPDGSLGVICTGDLLVGGRPQPVTVIADPAPATPAALPHLLASLLSAAPAEAPATVLCPRSESALSRALENAGFRATDTEIGLFLPLSGHAESLLAAPLEQWYVSVESVIGV